MVSPTVVEGKVMSSDKGQWTNTYPRQLVTLPITVRLVAFDPLVLTRVA